MFINMLENKFEFSNMCRLCTKFTMSLYSLYEDDIDGVSSIEKLKIVCGLEISDNDDYPKTICKICQRKLTSYYEFRSMCINSQQALTKYKVKPEFVDNFVETNNFEEEMEEIRYYIEVDNDDFNDDELLLTDVEQYFKTIVKKTPSKSVVSKNKYKKSVTKVNKTKCDPNKKHKCKVCKKRFSTELRVKLHMQRIHKQIYLAECKVVCPKCGMKFEHVRNLRRHLVYHNMDSYFGCAFCDKKTYSKKSWRKHIKTHDGKINIICKICNKTIVSKVANIYHMDYHHTKEVLAKNTLYFCQTCKVDFEHFSELETHSFEQHSVEDTKHTSKLNEVERNVEIIFGDINDTNGEKHNDTAIAEMFRDTNNTNSEKENETYMNIDTTLTKMFSDTSDTNTNIDTNNTNSETQNNTSQQNMTATNGEIQKVTDKLPKINALFKCNICSRLYKNLSDLKFHVDECYKKLNRPKSFMCDVCGKCFASTWALANHKKGHSNARPYICDICGQRFKWHNDLYNHKSRIHDKIRPYVCKICGKRCSTSATLKSHSRFHTGEKPFRCSDCGARFAQSASLKEHSLKHDPTGATARLACPVCNKQFRTPLRLRAHTQRHSATRPLHPCPTCHRVFTEKSSVRKHQLKIHQKDQDDDVV